MASTKQIDLFGNEIIDLKNRSVITGRNKDYIHDISDKAERRFLNSTIKFAKIKNRDGEDDDGSTAGDGTANVNENIIEGYAAVFNKPSQDFGGWIEQIAVGAFDGVLDDSDTVALFNHSCNLVLGRNKVNLSLSTDEVGLKYVIVLPGTTLAADIRALVKGLIINKSSFAFTVAEEIFAKGDPSKGSPHIRTITKIEKLYDVSPVTTPAYDDTDVAARSMRKIQAKEQIQASLKSLQEVQYIIQRQKFTLKNLNKK